MYLLAKDMSCTRMQEQLDTSRRYGEHPQVQINWAVKTEESGELCTIQPWESLAQMAALFPNSCPRTAGNFLTLREGARRPNHPGHCTSSSSVATPSPSCHHVVAKNHFECKGSFPEYTYMLLLICFNLVNCLGKPGVEGSTYKCLGKYTTNP